MKFFSAKNIFSAIAIMFMLNAGTAYSLDNDSSDRTENVYAESGSDGGFFALAKETIRDTWNEGRMEVFVPLYAWHNRKAYPQDKISKYNEYPKGLGIGKYRYDRKTNRDGLMFRGFSDSNYHFEPLLLYTWQKTWRSKDDFFGFSAGYMAGFTTRKEWHWVPLPMALPIISFDAGPISYAHTYVPGLGKENGNVWFSWMSVRF